MLASPTDILDISTTLSLGSHHEVSEHLQMITFTESALSGGSSICYSTTYFKIRFCESKMIQKKEIKLTQLC